MTHSQQVLWQMEDFARGDHAMHCEQQPRPYDPNYSAGARHSGMSCLQCSAQDQMMYDFVSKCECQGRISRVCMTDWDICWLVGWLSICWGLVINLLGLITPWLVNYWSPIGLKTTTGRCKTCSSHSEWGLVMTQDSSLIDSKSLGSVCFKWPAQFWARALANLDFNRSATKWRAVHRIKLSVVHQL